MIGGMIYALVVSSVLITPSNKYKLDRLNWPWIAGCAMLAVGTARLARSLTPTVELCDAPRSKKPPKITFSVCIQKFSRKVLRPLRGQHRFPLGCLPNVQSVDLTRRRELKPEVCLKIAPSVRVECAGQIQPIVLDAVD